MTLFSSRPRTNLRGLKRIDDLLLNASSGLELTIGDYAVSIIRALAQCAKVVESIEAQRLKRAPGDKGADPLAVKLYDELVRNANRAMAQLARVQEGDLTCKPGRAVEIFVRIKTELVNPLNKALNEPGARRQTKSDQLPWDEYRKTCNELTADFLVVLTRLTDDKYGSRYGAEGPKPRFAS